VLTMPETDPERVRKRLSPPLRDAAGSRPQSSNLLTTWLVQFIRTQAR
jgi:hypothetical protein